jgi:transposase
LARLDPKLLAPVKHRGEASQAHLALLRSRDALLSARTKLVNHIRGALKSFGARLPKCTAQSFHKKVAGYLPQELVPALEPVLKTIASLTEHIRDYDRKLEDVADELYQETGLLRQVHGVGALSALAFVHSPLKILPASPKAARWVHTWGWCPLPINREVAIHKSASAGTGTK